jgi:two-component system, cell cycle sensor histidine kinase and response regulator CckA
MAEFLLPSYADALSEGIGVVAAGGRVCAANEALALMLDYESKEQLVSNPGHASIFRSQADVRALDELVYGDTQMFNRRCTFQTRRGEDRVLTLTGVRRQDGMIDTVFVPDTESTMSEIAHLRDVLRRTQYHMVQTERIKAVGSLSGFFAHELNNVFGSVIGRAQLMQMKTTDERLLRECAYIVQAAEQGVGEVKRLLQFIQRSRQQHFGPLSMEEVFEEACAVIEPAFDRCRLERIPISIIKNFEKHAKIFGYVSELREIIAHLLQNAFDAMPRGGIITATCVYGDTDLSLSITDTGCGITNEARAKMFEAMFTTKGEQHAGMGLSIVKELLRKMKGSITYSTDETKGTVFAITIPKNEVLLEDKRRAPVKPSELDPRFVSKILIVDDDEGVLVSMDKLLSSKGFVTRAMLDSREAVRLARSFQPDIVITDLAMPEMNGWELAKQVRLICPASKIILTTAYTEMLTDVEMKQTAVDLVMQKPVNIQELISSIMTG